MTPIEQALFRDGSAHCVRSFELSQGMLVISLHPWGREQFLAIARFDRPHVVSVDDRHSEGKRELPWDIIGFESEPLPERRWHFCLHTDRIEYVFDSTWPEIT